MCQSSVWALIRPQSFGLSRCVSIGFLGGLTFLLGRPGEAQGLSALQNRF